MNRVLKAAVMGAILTGLILADVFYGVGDLIVGLGNVVVITLTAAFGYFALRDQGKTRSETVRTLTHTMTPVAFVDKGGDWQSWRRPVIGEEALRTGGPARRWARTLILPRSAWIEVLLVVAAVSLVAVFIEIHPNPDTLVVKPSLCSPSLGPPELAPPLGDCPFFVQHDRGLPWVFSRSVMPAPPRTDTEDARWSPHRASTAGVDPLALAGDLSVAILFGVAVGAGWFIRVWFDHLPASR